MKRPSKVCQENLIRHVNILKYYKVHLLIYNIACIVFVKIVFFLY